MVKSSSQTSTFARQRILVADSYADSTDSIVWVLKAHGHDATGLYDGRSLCRQVRCSQPDIVLLDLRLRDIDGASAAKHIGELPGPHPLIVAWTGMGREVDRRESAAAGCHFHFMKDDHERLMQLLALKQSGRGAT